MDLHQQLTQVTDEPGFRAFVQALIADRRDPARRDEWQNETIEDFLDAALAWAEDADWTRPDQADPATPWQLFARFLYCGKIYE